MLHIAKKAFYPGALPFPLLHVDTTWKFRDMYACRRQIAAEAGLELLVYKNPDAEAQGINLFDHGSQIHTDLWKTQGLKQAIDKYGFDAAFGGARRDEEKSRAKERIFSFRRDHHRWDLKLQGPELWSVYNTRMHKGEIDFALLVDGLAAFTSPFRAKREMARTLVGDGEFIEIFVDTPLEVAETRDVKGLYRKARRGEFSNFTGIDSPYESPESPEVVVNTVECSADEAAEKVIAMLRQRS